LGHETASGSKQGPRDATPVLGLASQEPTAGEIDALRKEAFAVSAALVECFPNSAEAFRIRGLVEKAVGKKANAMEAWGKALRLDPSRHDVYALAAEVAQSQADFEKAADLCRTGLLKAAAAPDLYRGLATALNSLGKSDEAVTILLRAVESFPKNAGMHQLLGKTYAQLDQQEKAKVSYEAALQLQPDNGVSLYGLVMACAKLGLDEQSRQLFDRCKKMEAENRAMVQGLSDLAWHTQIVSVTCGDAAMVYAAESRLKQAEELIRRATVLAPANATFRMRLAAVLVATNRPEAAIATCQAAIASEPKNPLHYMALAEIFARLGRFADASAAAKNAVDLAPDNAEYRRILSELQARR
jgi:tetratricopeptide (TPR) repeat protein